MKVIIPALILAAVAGGCRNSASDNAVPRRYAYPRIELPDTVTTEARLGDFSLRYNAEADTAVPRQGWLDIVYPRLSVTVNLSTNDFADEASLAASLANRRQRMSLNFGDAVCENRTFTNNEGIECFISGSPDAGMAPIYIIAVRRGSHTAMLSGAAVFDGSTEPADSIMPVYRAIYDDMVNLLNSLR